MKVPCVFLRILAMLLLSLSVVRLHAAPPLATQQLRAEYRVNPVGLDVARPRLSWIVTSSQRGQKQTAYQILVAGTQSTLKRNRGDLWDSGRVASNETAHILYSGRPLGSRQQVWWKVRTWDTRGVASAFSAPASWTTGLMNGTQEWKARWIGLQELPGANRADSLSGLKWVWFNEGNPAQSAPVATRYFRTRATLPANRAIKAARFVATADDQFNLWINGREAGKSSGQTDAWRTPAVLDVASFLKPGENVLAIAAQNTSAGAAGLTGKLTVEFGSGEPLTIPIDAGWKSASSAVADWQSAGFDDSAWVAARVIANVGDAPWGVPGQSNIVPPAPFLRKNFALAKPIRRAFAHASALGLYELHLNGQRVGDDIFTPGWTDYKKRVYYQTYDVTSLLKRGANAAGLIVGDGWATGHLGNGGRDRYGLGRPRASAQIEVEFTDGTRQTIITDASWKAAYGPIVEQDLLDGEFYDATREIPNWNRAVFNDATWQNADMFPDPAIKIEAYPGVTVKRQLELKPKSVKAAANGTYIFDLGQNMVGWVRLNVSGPRGRTVRLRFAEMLNTDGTFYTANMRGARTTDFYTLKGTGRETWEPRFTFHGFQFVEVSGLSAPPTLDTITGIVVHSDTPKTGTFVSSNPMVNQLQHNIEWGQRGNFLEVPTDCPQRDERLGWTGDAQVFVRTSANNMDVASFFSKWMVDVEDAQRGGAFTDVAPDVCCGAGTAAWGDAGVVVPWTIYEIYGDKQILTRHYDAMARWITYLEENSKNLLRPAEGYGDWLNIGADMPRDVIGTAYFAYSTELMGKIADALGKTDDATRYKVLWSRIRDAFNAAYVTPDGRIKGDTQTGYLLALRMNLLNPEQRVMATRHLVDDLQKREWHLSTGFVGVSYLNPVLTQQNRTDVAYRLLNQDTFPSWLFPIKHGATTIWERWDGWTPQKGFQDAGMNSFNHYALGSVGEWLFDTVAGIDRAEPGFKRISIRPRPGGGLSFARATYDSIRGRIESGWKIENGTLTLDVVVPANTTATVWVPTSAPNTVLESGKAAATANGVKFVRAEAGTAVFEVGSGTYHFSALR
ncbi:MAG: alpha-L-rhamnosidase [Abditibacteriota bacterium]|nr:alpha-L-rhamnosidase [Abditibacteriota bacterium]